MPIDRNDVHWFPLRVAFHRELRVRDELERLKVEHYLPLMWVQRTVGGHTKRLQVPALNLIFIRSTQEAITEMKMFNPELSCLRYKMNVCHGSDAPAEVMTVPDHDMKCFMLATRRVDERVQYLTYSDFLDKAGKKVQVIDGDFAGVEGKIKRIKKDRVVVVALKGIAAVSVQIPFNQLKFL